FSCTFVICTRLSDAPIPTISRLHKSCVSGRGGRIFCISITIDSASGCPIQIGSSRSPSFSCRITTYELDTLSSPRRATLTSTMMPPWRPSRTHVPRGQVLLLLVRQRVDVRADRGKLESSNLAVDAFRHPVHVARKTRSLLYQILRAQRLVREAHVHHAGRMAFGGRQVDQTPFAEQEHALTLDHVLLHELPHLARLAAGELLQRRN